MRINRFLKLRNNSRLTKLNKMEYTNLMMTGNVDEFWFKNMMLACLGHLNIQWDWPRCPSPWHSRHLYPFVMLGFQCLVASSLGQSMPHSCSFKDPMCFPFSNSGYMPATNIKITTFYRWQWKYLTALLSKFVPYGDHNFKDKCGIKLKIIKKQIQWTLWDHVIPSAFYSFHLISFTRISRGPSRHKSGSLNNKYHSTSQSKERKSSANVRTPSVISPQPLPNDPKTLPGPRPFQPAASTVAPAEISCSTTAAWPSSAAQCSAVRPRALRMWCGRSSSCGCRRETKRSNGMFLRVFGQKNVDRS